MPPELYFVLTLIVKMAVTAGFVLAATMTAERAGPLVGGLVATLPIGAGPVYVFLALDHDAHFIAQSAVGSLGHQCDQRRLRCRLLRCWRRSGRLPSASAAPTRSGSCSL